MKKNNYTQKSALNHAESKLCESTAGQNECGKSAKFPLPLFYESGGYSRRLKPSEMVLGVKVKSYFVLFDIDDLHFPEAYDLHQQTLNFGQKQYTLLLPNEKQAKQIAELWEKIKVCYETWCQTENREKTSLKTSMFWLDNTEAAKDALYAFNLKTLKRTPVSSEDKLFAVFIVQEIKKASPLEEG